MPFLLALGLDSQSLLASLMLLGLERTALANGILLVCKPFIETDGTAT